MAFPLFQFTLENSIEGTLEIKEPEGWDDGVLKLERNKDYNSLVEYWDQPLTFDDAEATDIFSGDTLPGGLEWIKNIEETQGIGAIITIRINISTDSGLSFRQIFLGTIAIDTVKEIDFYKAEYGVLRTDGWAKLINRKSIPIDIEAILDLDGNSIVPPISQTITLPSQIIRSEFERDTGFDMNSTQASSAVGTTSYLIWDNSNTVVDEVEDRAEYGSQISSQNPTEFSKYLFKAKYAGIYRFRGGIPYSLIFSSSVNVTSKFFFSVISGGSLTEIELLSNTASATVFEQYAATLFDETVTLSAGDEVYIYGRVTTNISLSEMIYAPDFNYIFLGIDVYTTLFVTANTTFPETTTKAFNIKSAGEGILSKITGISPSLLSDYLTSGCGAIYSIMKGLHIRGYNFTEKQFFLSFNEWWEGINPILNLGLGYEGDQVRIEPKSYFYDPVPSVYLDFVNMIERSYDLDRVIKSVEIGYEEWSAESKSGVDDPQSKRTYTTSLSVLGKDEKILSKFVAASLAIEQTRRNGKDKTKDWKLDDKTFIISMNGTTPELDENFIFISGLLNSSSRYNSRITPARNYMRWQNYVDGALQIPSGQEVKFSAGEGNYSMQSQLKPDDCEATDQTPEPIISEKGNFDVDDNFLCTPKMYTFDHPLTQEQYDIINENKNNAIAVSRTDINHLVCFIMNLDFKPTRLIGTFEVLVKGLAPVPPVPEDKTANTLTGESLFTGYSPTVTVASLPIDTLTGQVIGTGFSPTVAVGPPA
jgi:hypothetical protein